MLGLNIFFLFADKARCVPAVYEHKFADETLAPKVQFGLTYGWSSFPFYLFVFSYIKISL